MAAEGKEGNADLEAYLGRHKINDLFVKIVEELLLNQPKNPIKAMVDYLKDNHPEKFAPETTKAAILKEDLEFSDDEDEEDDEDDDYIDELPQVKSRTAKKHGNRRISVSASVIDASNVGKRDFPVFPKAPQEKEHLVAVLKQHMLFKQLGKSGMESVVMALERKEFSNGDVLIREGDKVADHFFILDSGQVEVLKDGKSIGVVYDKQGDGFGELALMYNAPRAVTIKSKSSCVCWALDRITFKTIVMSSVISRRAKIVRFLQRVPILSELTENEKMTVADSVTESEVVQGTVIVQQGAAGDAFYVVEEGEVECSKTNAEGHKDVCMTIPAGGYFGEIALLTSKPRQATVTATKPSVLLSMERKTFQRVMGPLSAVLQRNMVQYNAVFRGERH